MGFRLTQVFNTLPPEAQQVLVEKHLANLLDFMPKERSKKGEQIHPKKTLTNN